MEERKEINIEDTGIALGCVLTELAAIREKLDFIITRLELDTIQPKPISLEEAANFLSISDRNLRKLMNQGEIAYYKRGSKVYFFEKELVEWIKQGRIGTILERMRNLNRRNKR